LKGLNAEGAYIKILGQEGGGDALQTGLVFVCNALCIKDFTSWYKNSGYYYNKKDCSPLCLNPACLQQLKEFFFS